MVIRPAISGGHFVRHQRAVFPIVDDPSQHPRGPAFVIDTGGGHQLLEQTQLIVRVQNGEIAFQTHQFRVPPQELYTDRMKRAQPRHAFDLLAEHPAHAVLHLARGLVGEGHGEYFVGPCFALRQKVHNARGQRPRFACARTRQHQHRPVHLFDRLALRGV